MDCTGGHDSGRWSRTCVELPVVMLASYFGFARHASLSTSTPSATLVAFVTGSFPVSIFKAYCTTVQMSFFYNVEIYNWKMFSSVSIKLSIGPFRFSGWYTTLFSTCEWQLITVQGSTRTILVRLLRGGDGVAYISPVARPEIYRLFLVLQLCVDGVVVFAFRAC